MTEPNEADVLLGGRFKELASRAIEPTTGDVYTRTSPDEPVARRRLAWAGVAVASVVVLVAGGLLLTRDQGEAPETEVASEPRSDTPVTTFDTSSEAASTAIAVTTPATAEEDLARVLDEVTAATGARFDEAAARDAIALKESQQAADCSQLLEIARANGDLKPGASEDCTPSVAIVSVDGVTSSGFPIQASIAVFASPTAVPEGQSDRPVLFSEATLLEGYGEPGVSSAWAQEVPLGDGAIAQRLEVHGPRGVVGVTIKSADGDRSAQLAAAESVLTVVSQDRP